MPDKSCPHCGESYEDRIYYTIEEGGKTYIICPECDELISD